MTYFLHDFNSTDREIFIVHFPCSADHEQDWQPYPVDPYYLRSDTHWPSRRVECLYGRETDRDRVTPTCVAPRQHVDDASRDFYFSFSSNEQRGGEVGGGRCQTFFFFFFFSPVQQTTNERDWPPYQVPGIFFRVGNQYAESEKQERQTKTLLYDHT